MRAIVESVLASLAGTITEHVVTQWLEGKPSTHIPFVVEELSRLRDSKRSNLDREKALVKELLDYLINDGFSYEDACIFVSTI